MKMTRILRLLLAIVVVVMPAGCQSAPAQTQSPTAYIDEISPLSVTSEDMVIFKGHGTDADGTVVAYRWRSSISGDLGTDASFQSKLSPGSHIIYLKVQDNNGNWSDEVSRSIVVSDATPAPTPTATSEPEELPVVDVFAATPGGIAAGDSATLAWEVTGANSVTIDQGIGSVSSSGTRVVTPGDSTTYTLTAASGVGSVAVSTVVLVSAPPSPGVEKPDLVVTSIGRDGSVVKYTIVNQGTADAGPSNSRLFIDGAEKATDAVAALAAGASRTESFDLSYACSGTSDVLLVQVDKDNLVDESNESNNSFSTSWMCMMVVIPLNPTPVVPLNPGLILPGAFKSDLTVTNIWESGDRVHYRINNIGTVVSVPSTSELYVSGTLVQSEEVPAIAAGEYLDRYFLYHFSCILPMLKTVTVEVDVDETNAESDELNNSMKVSLSCH
ncbi:MAG: hypothetical protein JXA58_04235 [Dehalococcoidia bacterium]|nr:hypothetical protein [Dehalococcoidia bacterium]